MINVIIPAAGLATRMRPLTANISKAMLPVNGRPALSYILDTLKSYDIAQTVIVDGELNDIRARFPDYTYVRQAKATGPRDAIALGAAVLKNKELPVVVWLSDTIVMEPGLPLGSNFLLVTHKDDQSEWCVTNGTDFYNKPETDHGSEFKALVGIYSFSSGASFKLALIKSTDTYDISNLLTSYSKSWKLLNTTEHYDVGNFNNYYETCAKLKSKLTRADNTLMVNTFLGTITKNSITNQDKIQKEKLWYLSLNEKQKLFTPHIVSPWNSGLTMTLESGIALSDIQVYENLPLTTWKMIIAKIFRIMHEIFYDEFFSFEVNKAALEEVYLSNALKRIEPYDSSLTIVPWAYRLATDELIPNAKWSRCIHGDLHTGNILFEPTTGKLTLIDPKGEFGKIGPGGDKNYDLYKLFQDLYHGYHFLLYDHPRPDPYDIKALLCEEAAQYDYEPKQLINGGAFLMATCVPFHYDDENRQDRFLTYVKNYIKCHTA